MILLKQRKKKKPELNNVREREEELTPPSKSEIVREISQPVEKQYIVSEPLLVKHEPVIEKPSRTFSIKDILSEDNNPTAKPSVEPEMPIAGVHSEPKEEFSSAAFESAWLEFLEQLNGEGTRIVSMFKAIKPEVENDQTIKIHLNNATQKDTFVQNYKQRLTNFLENKFLLSGVDIETTVDQAETTDVLYTDEQKYTYLFTKYPILKEMKKTFNLDIT